MKTFRVLNDKGDIEVEILKRANVVFKTNEYNETENICTYKEIINIFDLLKENKKLNGTIQTYDILLKANVEENKQLKEKLDCDLQWAFKYEKQVDNWNKLKEYMIKEQTRIAIENTDEDEFVYTDLLNKMQEIEQGSDSNEI